MIEVRNIKPAGARVRCTGDTEGLGLPSWLFGLCGVVMDIGGMPQTGQLVDFGPFIGKLWVAPVDLQLVDEDASTITATRLLECISPRVQIERWVVGESVHRVSHDGDDGYCCPDYSCCMPELLANPSARKAFWEALIAGDLVTVQAMRGGFSALMMERFVNGMYGGPGGTTKH